MDTKVSKKLLKLFAVILLLCLGTSLGFYFGQKEAERRVINSFFTQGAQEDVKSLDFTLFWNAWPTSLDE